MNSARTSLTHISSLRTFNTSTSKTPLQTKENSLSNSNLPNASPYCIGNKPKPQLEETHISGTPLSSSRLSQSKLTSIRGCLFKRKKTQMQNSFESSCGSTSFISPDGSLLSGIENQLILKCQNHKQKRAKYKVIQDQEDQVTYYCSKCGFRLLKQGFNVQELSQSQSPCSYRQTEIRQLLKSVEETQPRLKKNLKLLGEMKQLFVKGYRKQLQSQNFQFVRLIDQIKGQWEKRKFALSQHLQQGLAQFEQHEQRIKKALEQLVIIDGDVRPNVQLINTLISQLQFSATMKDYREKVAKTSKILLSSNHFSMDIVQNDLQLKTKIAEVSAFFREQFSIKDEFSFDQSACEQEQCQRKQPFRRLFTHKEQADHD